MKKRLLMPLACLVLHAHAATYYVSSVSGDDSRSATQARNSTTPWKTLNKINSFFANLQPGDSVLFKRGETFYGQLDISQSGTSTAPIVISAYGSGAKPIITGFTKVTNWVSLGSGIWESAASVSTLQALNMVAIDGVSYAMGRYPNANTSNKGYLTIDSHSGTTSVSCASLPSSPDWDGARVVLRTRHWVMDTSTVKSHSGTTITFLTPPVSEPMDQYGFFIENHPRTLDQYGEWYYNPSTKKLRVFFGTKDPSTAVVNATSVDNPVRCFNRDYIRFDNLNVQGANVNGIYFYSAAGVYIKNCNVSFCANTAIDGGTDDVNAVIENNVITDIHNYGIDMRGASDNQSIRNNIIKRIGLFAGMGGFGSQTRTGIAMNSGQNNHIEGNQIDSVGFVGIRFGSNYATIKNNVISNFTLVLDDGGGILTGNQTGDEKFGRKILNNLVYNGIGAKEGTPNTVVQQSSGIYTDDNSSGIEIAGNSVWNCGKVGLYIHNSYKINIHDNTFYNNTVQTLLNHDNDTYPTLSNIVFKRNIGFAKTPDQRVAYFYSRLNDIASFGALDSNYYARPVDDDTTIIGITGLYTSSQITSKYTLSAWKLKYSKDLASKKSPVDFPITINPDDSIRFEYNPTNTSKTIALDGSYIDVQKNSYSNSIVLAPYSSAVLIKTGTLTSTITPKAPTVSLTSPTASASYSAPAAVTLTAAASDADGTVSKVEFYNGTTLLGTKTSSPYTFNWQNVAAGQYTLTAKATDNSGLATTSAPVAITVSSTTTPNAPSVSLTSPTANASYMAPASIELNATASDVDGTISKVEFYRGTTLLATITTSPYKYTWQNVAAGTYSITAKATDNSGLTTTTSSVTVSVTNPVPPTVSLTSSGTNFKAPASITLTADANDADGNISKVEFFNGSTLLATRTTAPYTFTWQNVAVGNYNVTAKATDNSGLTATSAPVAINVVDPNVNLVLTPNPVSTTLYITINGLKKNKSVKIAILNNSGNVVKTLRANATDQVITVDVSGLQPQLYTVQVNAGFTVLSGQFLKL